MNSIESSADKRSGTSSDHDLLGIAEQGFFVTPGGLATARSACAELIFARAMIGAQTTIIAELSARLAVLCPLAA